MTQLSREILENLLQHNDETSSSANAEMWEVNEMVRRLLAVEGREPVGEVVLGSRDDEGNYPHAHAICLAGDGCADWDNFPDGFKLYAAPPVAQPVQVPECFNRLLKHAYGMSMGNDWNNGTMAGHHREALCKAVEDCRTAMLQPSSGALQLPQWIKCSERMPENCDGVFAWSEAAFAYAVEAYFDGSWYRTLTDEEEHHITHWMPLPEPPQEPTK